MDYLKDPLPKGLAGSLSGIIGGKCLTEYIQTDNGSKQPGRCYACGGRIFGQMAVRRRIEYDDGSEAFLLDEVCDYILSAGYSSEEDKLKSIKTFRWINDKHARPEDMKSPM